MLHKKFIIAPKGFTIVELLIVIVVIAILAAISIVAYNGIQTRAENNKTISAVSQYTKSLRLFKEDSGSYPLTAPSVFTYKCIGEVGTACAMISGTYTSTECESLGGLSNLSTDPDVTILNNALKKFATYIPQPSQQRTTCDNRDVTGVIYFVFNNTVLLRYFQKGNVVCSPINGLNPDKVFFSPNTTRCQITLP